MKLKPRDYQREAAKWALEEEKAVIIMPTGAGKTLIASIWVDELMKKGKIRKVLFLEPTRFLVEQNARFLRDQGLDASPVHGSLPKGLRERGWSSKVVVATPEVVLADWDKFEGEKFDAVVVDECHHTTGKDAYLKVVRSGDFKYRLGLSAYIPPSRRKEIEDSIGRIRSWGWDDPRIAPYIPEWGAEVYEAPLTAKELSIYEAMESLWESHHGPERALLGNAIRWFVRDGALALLESLDNSIRLSKLLGSLREDLSKVRQLHKLESLKRALRDHEGFEKSIIFVERVSVARAIAKELGEAVLILGRRRIDPKEAITRAKMPENKLIVSTSAGEEGIDLPESDLLIIWSNVASPLRFIQRIGRVLRAGKRRKHKWVVFLVTPDTVDVDSLIDGLLQARKAGISVNVSEEVVEYVWSLSRRRKFLEALDEEPMPVDILSKALGAPLDRSREALRWLCSKGLAFYIFTPAGKVYFTKGSLGKLKSKFAPYLKPEPITAKIRARDDREISLRGDYEKAITKLSKIREFSWIHFSTTVMDRGVERLINLTYSFRVSDQEVLDVILRNAYSARRIYSP